MLSYRLWRSGSSRYRMSFRNPLLHPPSVPLRRRPEAIRSSLRNNQQSGGSKNVRARPRSLHHVPGPLYRKVPMRFCARTTQSIYVVLSRCSRHCLLPLYHPYADIALILSGDAVKQYAKFGGLKFEPELNPAQFQQNGIDMIVEAVKSALLSAGGLRLGGRGKRI